MSGLPEYVRVFTAIELLPAIRSRLDREREVLFADLGRLGLPPAGNLHVTLKFVGDVHRDHIAALCDAVSDGAALLTAGGAASPGITVEGVGAFPNLDRPRVIWAGVSDPQGILTPVHERLNTNLAEFGAQRERKRYVPHVTLARIRKTIDTELLRDRIEDGCPRLFGTQAVTGVTLFMSEPVRGRPPRYTVLGRCSPGGSSPPEEAATLEDLGHDESY